MHMIIKTMLRHAKSKLYILKHKIWTFKTVIYTHDDG